MIIKILIVLGSIIIDTLYNSIQEEHASKQDNIQFVKDAVVWHQEHYSKSIEPKLENLGTPRFFITNVEELDVNHVGIIFEAIVDLDKDWLKKGDIVVLEKDGSEWFVKHDVRKYSGAFRYHLKSFVRSTKHIAAGDTIYRDRKIKY